MLKQISNFFIFFSCVFLLSETPTFALLSCSITTSAGCSNTKVLRMSSLTNAHAELSSLSTSGYSNNVICCTGLSGTSCSGNFAPVLNLSSTTNAHVEIASNSNYPNIVCIASGEGIPVVAYQDTNCVGYDTTLASISSTTNATIGNTTNYTKKICAKLDPYSLSFSISTTTLYFGGLSSVVTRYASSTNTGGDSSETEAHNLKVKTNIPNGYTITVRGATLTSGANTVTAIGSTNISPAINTEQFGIRLVATGGVGTVTVPYSASGFAYSATNVLASQIASASSGDNATTTYSVRYVANIAGTTEMGAYTSGLVFVTTANF